MVLESDFEAVAALGKRGRYRKHTLETKRAIVQQCLAPGASVSAVALAHGVNANLVRKWIPKYRAGEYGQARPGVPLLPVTLREAAPAPMPAASTPKGHIDIELASGRVQVHGRVDVEMLRAVLASLVR